MSKNKLTKRLSAAQEKSDWKEAAVLCSALGALLQEEGKLQEALEYHTQEQEYRVLQGDKLGAGVAHRHIGEILSELNSDEALTHFKKYLLIAKEVDCLVEQQRAYATIGRAQLDAFEKMPCRSEQKEALKDARDNFLMSLQICKDLHVVVTGEELALMRCRLYINLGLVAHNEGDPKKAIDMLFQASSLAQQHKFHEDLYRSKVSSSLSYLKLSKPALALEEVTLILSFIQNLQASQKIDVYILLGRIHVYLGNIVEAKRYYKAAHAINSKDYNREQKRCLKLIRKLHRLHQRSVRDIDVEEYMKHYEKIADLCAELKCYDRAIEYYKMVLDKAHNLGKMETHLVSIYYSIAKTYDDNKQYSEAMEYYQKEFDVRIEHEPNEACKTLLAMAAIEEYLDVKGDKLHAYFERALLLAKQANNPKLQKEVLQLYLSCQDIQECVRDQLQDNLTTICETYEESNSNVSEVETSDLSDSDDMSSESSENEDASHNSKRLNNSNNKIGFQKLNLYGETKLHKACINGDINKVEQLIQQGHPVNIRDYSGWLPIHEACNHGHYQVVEVLVSAGAHVNDRGGKECNGFTPLHDAAANGHLNIVRLLLRKGASVVAKTNDGQTPLDVLLEYKHSQTLCQEDLDDISLLETEIIDAMNRAGCVLVSKSPQRKKTRESLSLSHSRKNNISSEDDSSDGETQKPAKETNAVDEYRNVIAFFRNARSGHETAKSNTAVTKSKSGLIPEVEFIDEDEFLENDTVELRRKRKRRSGSDELLCKSERNAEKNFGDRRKSMRCKTKQCKITSLMKTVSPEEDLSMHIDDYDLDLAAVEPISTAANCNDNEAGPNDPTEHQCFDSEELKLKYGSAAVSSENHLSKPIRLRVKVEDKTILVPVSEVNKNANIEWLCKEISLRYFQLNGIRPELSLSTSDGAILLQSDPLGLVLDNEQELLTATVSDWELPPLHQRYMNNCLQGRLEPSQEILSSLTSAESSGMLCLPKTVRSLSHIKLVLRTVQRHQHLHVISLAHTRLTDDNFCVLLQGLPTLHNLRSLDVQACGLTYKSCSEFGEKIQCGALAKVHIDNINMGYNNFQGTNFRVLLNLMSIPSALSLNLCHCHMDIQFVPNLTLSASLSLCTFIFDFNRIDLLSLNEIIKNAKLLTHLSLRGIHYSVQRDSTLISSSLTNLLGIDECLLQHLELCNCELSDEDVSNLACYMYRCKRLQHLGLSYNKTLSNSVHAVCELLSEIAASVSLTCLQLHGIPFCRDLDRLAQSLLKLIRPSRCLQRSLNSLSFNRFESCDSLISCWMSSSEQNVIKEYGGIVFLNVSF